MTYIILRDTMGDGLELIPNIDLFVIDKDELPQWTLDAAEIIMGEDGYESVIEYETESGGTLGIENEIVICKIVDKIDNVDVNKWIRHHIIEGKIEKSNEEYKEYLRLKEKFENNIQND